MLFFRIINKWVTECQEFTLVSASVLTLMHLWQTLLNPRASSGLWTKHSVFQMYSTDVALCSLHMKIKTSLPIYFTNMARKTRDFYILLELFIGTV